MTIREIDVHAAADGFARREVDFHTGQGRLSR